MVQSRKWWEGEGPTLHARTWVNESALRVTTARGSDWGRHPPRSADAFHQTYFEPLTIVVIAFFPFSVFDDVVFFEIALESVARWSATFALAVTSILASVFTVTGLWATPPIKLAAEPSRITVFTKLVRPGYFTPAGNTFDGSESWRSRSRSAGLLNARYFVFR